MDLRAVAQQDNKVSIQPLFYACIPLSVPADIRTIKGRVAVVARGVCDFSQKVTLMQDAGAVGVIVVNSEKDGETLAMMKRNDSKVAAKQISIPSVMISFQSWTKFAPCTNCLLYTSPSPRDQRGSRMPSSA